MAIASANRSRSRAARPRSSSTAVTATSGGQQGAGQDAEPGPDLEDRTTRHRRRLREDPLEDVDVDQEVLAERVARAQARFAEGPADLGRIDPGGRAHRPASGSGGAGVEVQAGPLSGREPASAGGADHRPVVGAQPGSRDDHRQAGGGRVGLDPLTQDGVRRDAAADHDGPRPGLACRTERLRRQDVDDGRLEAVGQLGDGRLRERGLGVVGGQARLGPGGGDDPSGGGLEPAEAEVVRLAQPGAREDHVAGDGGLRRTLDGGTARIPETEQPADLVERLAGRIVDGLAEQPEVAVVAHLDEERVPAGHDQGDDREGRLGSRRRILARIEQPAGLDVTLEVIDPDQGRGVDVGQRLGEVDPHQERAGQARTVGHRDGVDVAPVRPGVVEGGVEDGHDPAQVSPRGHLGHDPAGRGVEGDLAGDDVGVDPAAALDQRDAGLVAARFDRQQQWSAHPVRSGASVGRTRPGRSASSSAGRVGSGAASMAARRLARRSRIAGPSRRSVVMISASSWLSV